MHTIRRHTFLELAALGLTSAAAGGAAAGTAKKAGALDALGLKPIGHVAPRTSTSIETSPLSVGFEVLRKATRLPLFRDPERVMNSCF
jgi:hypothetical protein